MEMARKAGHEVYGVDRKPILTDYPEDWEVHSEGDISEFKVLQDHLLQGPRGSRLDAIVHLAGSTSTIRSMKRPYQAFRDNVVTMANICQIAEVLRIPILSTSSVKARDGMTPYGASKRMAELWASELRGVCDMTIVINRPGTVYGPGQEGSAESGWIAWFLKAKAEGFPVTINGDGDHVRDLLHVDDYCRLLLVQLGDLGRYSLGVWDVGGGVDNAVSVRYMATHLGLEYIFGPPRHGDAARYVGHNLMDDWKPQIHWRDSGMFD